MKIMLSCLAFLMMLGCVTEKPTSKQDDTDKYKPLLGTWVGTEKKDITITFSLENEGRKVTLNVGGDMRYGTWNYSNSWLVAYFPNMVGADGQPLKDSAMNGEFDAAGNLLLKSGNVTITFRRADDAAPKPPAPAK